MSLRCGQTKHWTPLTLGLEFDMRASVKKVLVALEKGNKAFELDLRESVIEKHLVKRVKELGGEVRKVQWIGRRGAPDRLVMLPEYRTGFAQDAETVWVELKATGVKPETHQLREHERMRAMGQRVVVIDSIEGVEELLS
jgi:hypothetical protein